MTLIQENWQWISSNIWVALGLAGLCFGAGWLVANLFYKERIEILKERLAKLGSPSSIPSAFEYPPCGRHGKNVLANSINEVRVAEPISFRAEIPPTSKLHIELEGPKPTSPDDVGGSWYFNVSKINWSTTPYQNEDGGRQSFDAEGGTADLQLTFARAGEVKIKAFEGNSQTPSWEKTLRVRAT